MKRIFTFLIAMLSVGMVFGGFYSGGGGSSSSPYLISNLTDLEELVTTTSDWASGIYFKQTADIDISSHGNWTPIGTSTSSPFLGTYDGDGHKITGLTITSYSSAGAGLFGYNRGTIKNLGVSGNISGVTNNNTGILAGLNYYGTIQNCYTEGSVSSSGTNVGGFVGSCSYSVSTTKSYSTATVTATGPSSANIGGFVGYTNASGSISECYCTGNVSNANDNSGGNKANTGGFVGASSLTISNCYSTGNVTCSSGGERFGGFCGLASYNTPITNCYSVGSVTGTSSVKGGFVGYYNTGTFTRCFFNSDNAGSTISGYGSPTGITAATTSTMQTASTWTTAGWSTSYWNFTDGSYPQLLWTMSDPATSTFSGTGSWSETARWSDGLPGTTTDVTIAGTCTVDADYEVTDMTINSGAVVSIAAGNILTVSGSLTNNAGSTGLVLASSATETGMLMNNSTGVQATVQQYLVKEKWHYMGIPVTKVTNDSTVFRGCYVLTMSEALADSNSASGWDPLVAGESMYGFQGYAVRYGWAAANSAKPNDTTITFYGTLNTGVIDTTFTKVNDGWNFISNPYPTTIDWDAGSGKSTTNLYDAIYLWNPNLKSGSGDYGCYGAYITGGSINSQTQYIPPMQGFFVKASAASSSLSFNDNAKISHPIAFKSTAVEPQIKLAVTDNSINFDEMLLRVKNGSTQNFDGNFDAYKLIASASRQPQLYSELNGIQYSINSIPEITKELKIPLKVLIKTSGEHRLVIKDIENYHYSFPILLMNESGQLLADLQTGDYVFDAIKDETKSFVLSFANPLSFNTYSETSNELFVDVHENILRINRMDNIPSEVVLYNALGQTVYHNRVKASELSIPIPKAGLYIVKVSSENGHIFNGKAIVKF